MAIARGSTARTRELWIELRIHSIDGHFVPGHRGWILTYPFNMLGALPAISVPCGRARSGVPIGTQLIARPLDDRGVIRAARAFERARGHWYVDTQTPPDL